VKEARRWQEQVNGNLLQNHTNSLMPISIINIANMKFW
jgi:hypothetical protein